MAKPAPTKKSTATPAPASTKAEGPAARRERKAREREELQARARREAQVRQAVKLVTHPCAPPHSRVAAAELLLKDGLQDLPKDLVEKRAELEAQAKKLLPEEEPAPAPEAPPASAPAEAPPAPPAE